jgi:hypothetical protein
MNRILNFRQYLLNEQETEVNRPETEREAKSRIASSLLKTVFGNIDGLTGGIDNNIEITKEVKAAAPYTACGGSAFQLTRTEFPVKFFKNVLEYLQTSKGIDHSRALKELEEGRSLVVGIRNKIDIKSKPENNDKFTDTLYLIEQKSTGETLVKPYQITTSPSLAYYGKKPLNPQGIGIKLPGDTLYVLENHKMGHGTYVLMAEAEPIEVGRYPIGTVKYETYKPVDKFKKQYCGMQIHRSSTGAPSPCIGPWSAGCQVFSDIKEFDDFIARAKKQTANSNKFIYALIELDSFYDKADELMKGSAVVAKEDKKKKEDKKSKDVSSAPVNVTAIKKLANYISSSYSSINPDEESLISTYNSIIKSKRDADELIKQYKEIDTYKTGVRNALTSFMNNEEMARLKFSV